MQRICNSFRFTTGILSRTPIRPALKNHSGWISQLETPQSRQLSTMSADKVKIALCQILVGEDKEKNIETARNAVHKAVAAGAQIVSLPECWNSPYATTSFPKYAEAIPERAEDVDEALHPSTHMLKAIAKQNAIYLIGGSIPERDGEHIYNTCTIFGPDGSIIGRHRKVHLFDIDVPGKITFKESDTLSPGNSLTLVDTSFGKIGVGICYDIRFPELAMLMRDQGATLLVYPGAFNTTTGPLHWELLQRARAVDNQLYVAAVSPARNPESGYQAWGHSTIVSPWGDVVATTSHEPDLVIAELDFARVEDMRKSIPVLSQRREDLYKLQAL